MKPLCPTGSCALGISSAHSVSNLGKSARMKVRQGVLQLLLENLETSTAKAISTPQRHLSHITCPHPGALSAPSPPPAFANAPGLSLLALSVSGELGVVEGVFAEEGDGVNVVGDVCGGRETEIPRSF